MNGARLFILLAFVGILLAPFVVRRNSHASSGFESPPRGAGPAAKLVIVTPHVPQIRDEFDAGFKAWHFRKFGQTVETDWRQPGGTTEILKTLQAQYGAILSNQLERQRRADPTKLAGEKFRADAFFPEGSVAFDVMFGGGSFDHGRLKNPKTVSVSVRTGEKPDGTPISRDIGISISIPMGFPQAKLDEWFGENKIGAEKLYDPDQYWVGTALSGFGIVFNRPLLKQRGMPEPNSFSDLGNPGYTGLLAMADARQSGSVATLYDSILNKHGWDKGWRILREMSANARYFASSSTMPPIDVGQGEALAGVAIDFYGRGQAQSLLRPGETPETGRVGYIDPPGEVYIDADPVSILRGGPNPLTARRFVEFVLSDEGQALWQFPPVPPLPGSAGSSASPNPRSPDDASVVMGPRQHRLRRMPVRRTMYQRYLSVFTDKTNPFEIASDTKPRGWRTGLIVMMGCFGSDASDELRAAWKALCGARVDKSFPPDRLAEMEELFFAMPPHTLADGTLLTFDEASYKAIATDKAPGSDVDCWRDPVRGPRAKMGYTAFFRETFAKVVELSRVTNRENTTGNR